jgi:hypothetical protein
MKREERIHNQATNYGYAIAGGSIMRPLVSKAFLKGAKWADANQPSPWISVEDKLPELEKEVIILDKRKHTDIGFITDDGYGGYYWWKNDETIWCKDDEITHWMPIPELPKEEKK